MILNINAMVNAMYYGFVALAAVESVGKALIFTKQSSTPALAYRRFKSNVLHAKLWFLHPIKPESMSVTAKHIPSTANKFTFDAEPGNRLTQFGGCTPQRTGG